MDMVMIYMIQVGDLHENVSFINDFYKEISIAADNLSDLFFVSTFVLFQCWNHEPGRHCTQGCKASHTSGPGLFTTTLLLA